mgnify:CR=1 FL=1
MRIIRSPKGKGDKSGTGPGRRQLRVGEAMRHALSSYITRGELHDPDLFDIPVTITEVSVSPDLKNATAYVMPLTGRSAEKVIPALRRAAPFLRSLLAKEIDLRVAPHLTIELDTTFENASRIDEVLRRPNVARDLAPSSDDKKDQAPSFDENDEDGG